MSHHHGRVSGWIEVICGPMFSGKTEELIRRVRLAQIAKQRVQIFKPAIDNRYVEEFIISHSDQKFVCQPVPGAAAILTHLRDATRVIGVDEAQFFDAELVAVCEKLADRGIRVTIAGLDQDYLGRPFGPMPQLLAVADVVLKSQAVCMVCGGVATKSQRLTPEAGQVIVGSGECYEARCRACFDPDFSLAQAIPAIPIAVRREG
ncbi:MAG: thymidine kinase [Deltaproteobacteria bacterium]|nr:thymidine kinase [Deltaproteobacteria bacterium]